MINSVESLNNALDAGANGIEFDIQFNQDGKPLNVYHGYICDCFRMCDDWTDFKVFIQNLRNITTPTHKKFNNKLVIAFVDLKTTQFQSDFMRLTAGQKLFDLLAEHLFNFGKVETELKIVLSLLNTYDEYIIRGFMNSLQSNELDVINDYIAWDISEGGALGGIKFMYKKLLKTYDLNIWQSDGLTNCLRLFVPMDRISSAVLLRDSKAGYMSKVCLWTIDMKEHMRQALRIGVDSIMTNRPAQLNEVLKEKEFSSKFRLATRNDDPWIRFEN